MMLLFAEQRVVDGCVADECCGIRHSSLRPTLIFSVSAPPYRADICNFLMSSYCRVDVLDLSWNVMGEKGAVSFSNALPHNKSLSELNLASNSIGDDGGQRVIKSLKYHPRMAKFNVSQNDISDGSCFVVAQVTLSPLLLLFAFII
jgi:hypothetical protein